MIAYKGFNPGLVCRGYKFDPHEWNETGEANCVKNGFHAATNPLDVLSYYPNAKKSIYCMVECAGDLDEDGCDDKVSCTRIRILRMMSFRALVSKGLEFIADHPKRDLSSVVRNDAATAEQGYAIVKGNNPKARGKEFGDILGYVRTDESGRVTDIVHLVVDNWRVLPDVWYTFDEAIEIKEALDKDAAMSAGRSAT